MKRNTQLPRIRRSGRSRAVPMAATALATLALLAAGGGTASATPSHWERYHDTWGPEVSFCGHGLVQQGAADGRVRFTAHGPDGLPYYYDAARFTETWTNPATGEFVTVVGTYKQSALHVMDNGDGTVTILFSGPGKTAMYSEDGALIARRTGVSRFVLVFDQAGTPTDGSDDQFLANLGTVKSPPQSFNFCDTLVQAIG